MTAVIRIKRQLNEDPLDAILLNCKRRKVDNPSDTNIENLSAVLKFAGTVNDPEEDVLKHIKKSTKSEIEEQYKKHTSDIISKLRIQNEATTKSNRYKIINSFRTNDSEGQNSEADVNFTVVDVETDTKNTDESDAFSSSDSAARFVYDLYYTDTDGFGEADLNEFISVYPLSDGLIYGSQRDNGYAESDSNCSEDSNAENNCRNDYPDESDVESEKEPDDNSVTEDDMLRAMRKVTLDEDLSSDEYDGAFLYDRDEDYESRYSRFKAKGSSDAYCDDDDDEDED